MASGGRQHPAIWLAVAVFGTIGMLGAGKWQAAIFFAIVCAVCFFAQRAQSRRLK